MALTLAQIAQLEEAKQNLLNALVAVTGSPGPNYTIGDQTVNKADYMRQLREDIAAIDAQIDAAEGDGGGWEVRSYGYV